MSLNATPSGERLHIGFFGRRNAGKSSLVNAVCDQDLAVVSDQKGTTTDPVYKAMELLPIGPVQIIDTPGYDDEGDLGSLRVRKTRQILNRTDLAVLVVDAACGIMEEDRELIGLFQKKGIPFLIVMNKMDLLEEVGDGHIQPDQEKLNSGQPDHRININDIPNQTEPDKCMNQLQDSDRKLPGHINITGPVLFVSARDKKGIHTLKEEIARLGAGQEHERFLVRDLIEPGDLVLLVIPIDASAPKGRLILPQQQVIRDILERGAAAICVREKELKDCLHKLGSQPALVITDSQVFGQVAEELPEDIPLTSFSILMARYKGLLDMALTGVWAMEELKDGDRILIAEGCTHHRQCEDIGTVKIPAWLKKKTGRDLTIETCSGREFPEDLASYSLIIHCGGCMLNEREVLYRMKSAADQGVPITNYGIAIAYMKGILDRSIRPLGPGNNQSHRSSLY